jgi:SPP1 family predicted phage head-tail adaptor
MRAGELDRRLTLFRAVRATDALNAKVTSWSRLATVAAAKADVSDAERIRAQQAGVAHTTRFRIRWSSCAAQLLAGDRVRCEGRDFEVVGLKELGRREGLEITANARGDLPPKP